MNQVNNVSHRSEGKEHGIDSEMQLDILPVRDVVAAFEFKARRRMWCTCICWFGVRLDDNMLRMLFLPPWLLYGPEIYCSEHRKFGKRILSHSKGGRKHAVLVSFYSIKVKNLPEVTQVKPESDSKLSELLLKGQSARVLPGVPKDSRCPCLGNCWGCPAVLWDLLTIGYEWELGHPAHV